MLFLVFFAHRALTGDHGDVHALRAERTERAIRYECDAAERKHLAGAAAAAPLGGGLGLNTCSHDEIHDLVPCFDEASH